MCRSRRRLNHNTYEGNVCIHVFISVAAAAVSASAGVALLQAHDSTIHSAVMRLVLTQIRKLSLLLSSSIASIAKPVQALQNRLYGPSG